MNYSNAPLLTVYYQQLCGIRAAHFLFKENYRGMVIYNLKEGYIQYGKSIWY